MGLPAAAAVLWTLGTLVLLTTAASMEDGDLSGPCSATLAPEGPCQLDKDECPYVFNLPPMTVNFPKKLMELERLVEELQLLKDNVDELRRICKDCAVSQSERECGGGTEHSTSKHSEDGNPGNAEKTMWEQDRENNKKVQSEDGKSLEVEQVAAAGKNVRITAGKTLDRKQIDRREKGVLDKLLRRVSNASQKNKTIGKGEVLRDRVMDRETQIEAEGDGREGKKEFERGGWPDETVLDDTVHGKSDDRKSDYQIPISSSKEEQEDVLKRKEEETQSRDKGKNTEASDHRIWPDKHHEVDHERAEKNYSNINKSEEEPIDRPGPDVWDDKSQVDKNQMQRGRSGDGIEERGKTRILNQEEKNTLSGRHVWPDETMESGSAGRIKLSEGEGGDKGQDPSEMDGNKKKAKQAEREKTNYQQPSQSNPNENLEHSNIDELAKVEEQHTTDDLDRNRDVQGERKNIYESPTQTSQRNTDTEPSSVNIQTAKNTSKLTTKAAGVSDKVTIKTSNSGFTTNIGQRKTISRPTSQPEREKTNYQRPSQNNPNENLENSNIDAKVEKSAFTINESDNNRDVGQEERKTTYKSPSQTGQNIPSSVDILTVKNTSKLTTKAADVPDKVNITTSNSGFTTNIGQRKTTSRLPSQSESEKTNYQRPSQSNPNENLENSNIDELAKVEKTASTTMRESEERKTTYKSPLQTKQKIPSSVNIQTAKNTSKLTIKASGVSDKATNSRFTTNIGQRKTTPRLPSQPNYEGPSHSNTDELVEVEKTSSIRKSDSKDELTTKVSGISDRATIKTSNSGFTTNLGQQKTTQSQGEGEKPIKEMGKELKGGRPAQKPREFENSGVMEGTDLGSLSQPSVINSGFIDLEQTFTLTSPPTFTALHSTADVKPGQRESVRNNEMGGNNEHSRKDAESAGEDEDYKMESAEENVENAYDPMEGTVWKKEWNKDKVDLSGQRKPTKTEVATNFPAIVSNSDVTTDAKQGYRKTNYQQPSQSSSSNEILERSNVDALDKVEKTTHTILELDQNKDVVQGERKTTYESPSQTIQNEKITQDSSVEVQLAKNTSKLTTKVANGSDKATHTTPNSRFTTNLGQRKTTSGATSQSNHREKDRKNTHVKLTERLTKILAERRKIASTMVDSTSASPTTSNSHFAIDLDEEPTYQNNYNKMDTETHLAKNSSQANAKFEDPASSVTTESKSHPSTVNDKQGQQKTPSQNRQDKDITTTNSHAMTNLEKGNQKLTKRPTSQSNQDTKESEHSRHDAQLAKATSQPKTSELDEDAIISTTNLEKGKQKLTKRPTSQSNQDNTQSEGSGNDTPLAKATSQPKTSALDEDLTSFITTNSPDITNLGKGNKKITKKPTSQSNKDEKDSERSVLDEQSAKPTGQPKTSALDEDAVISTPTLHVTTNLKKGNQNIAKRPTSQSNQNKKDNNHSILDEQSPKATSQPKTSALDEDATISTTNSHVTTNLEKGNQKTAKWPTSQSNQDNDDLSTKAICHSKISASDEDVTISTSTVSKSKFATDHKKLPKWPKSQSNQDERVTDHMHSNYHANLFPSQATTVLSDVTTSSTPSDRQRSLYRPSSTENEKHIHSEQSLFDLAKVRSQPTRSAFMEDISSTTASTVTLRHGTHKNEIPLTTYTSHHISPTTTSPPTAEDRLKAKMNMSKKTIQDQVPKAKVGMKPEANQKTKNVKNDSKPDRASLPDIGAKDDQRQKPFTRPGKPPRPVQIPKFDQSAQSHSLQVRGNETDNQLTSPVPVQKSLPTPFPRLMDVNVTSRTLTDDHHNATLKHDQRYSEVEKQERTHGILTNEGTSDERQKEFIKKAGQNVTSSIMLNQNNLFNGTKDRLPGQSIPKNPKLNPKLNQKTKPAQVPKVKPVHPKMKPGQTAKVKPKLEQMPKAKIPKPFADLKNTSKVSPTKPKVIPALKTKTPLKPKSKESTDMVPTSGPIKLTTERATEFKSTTSNPETTPGVKALGNNKVLDGPTLSTNSRITYNGGSQTTSQAPSILLTTLANKVIQESTRPLNSDFSQREKVQATKQDRTIIASSAPWFRSLFRSTTPGPNAPAAEATTPSARELRVKINQVAAFLNKSSTHPHGRGLGLDKQTERTDKGRTDIKPVTILTRDCSDHMLRGHSKTGVYMVRPDPSAGPFHVLCELEEEGGGWTVLQRRQDGSVSFNRSWAEYREGFGQLDGGEFWLGNTYIHLLTRDRPMELRVELEDFEGVQEYAHYQLFKVSSERLRYRLSVDGYSGTAGDALRFSSKYDHNNRAFTTLDRDNDRYPSGNCGAYYSSGWWFDACMAANLNGRYYMGRYKGVRDGIYWGTWHNISSEYYPTNERLSFKTVRMMIRPQGFKP